MIVEIEQLLNADEIAFLTRLFEEIDTRAGAATASAGLSSVKRNRELDLGERREEVRSMVLEACDRMPSLNYALLPKMVSAPLLSVYEVGMSYGTHVDSAVGEDRGRVFRSDISATIFLDAPDTYDGGELEIDSEYGDRKIKLAAGDAAFYPTLFRHRVLPVTRGRRRACVLWIESLIRDPAKRIILNSYALHSS